MGSLNLNVTVSINRKRLGDLICCALEGGSNYWCDGFKPDIYPIPEGESNSVEWGHEAVAHGASFTIEHDFDGIELHITNNDEHLVRTMELMATKYPAYWNDFMTENEDASTGDVFFQLLCFGEIVYG